MTVRRGAATMAFACALSAPSSARSQAVTVTPAATMTAGYAASRVVPDDPAARPLVQSGPFATVGSSLGLTYETPRTDQSLSTSLTLTLPFRGDFTLPDQSLLLTARTQYTGLFTLTERTSLTLGLALSATPVNPAVSSLEAYDTPIAAAARTSSFNVAVQGGEELARELSATTKVAESARVVYNLPIDDRARARTLDVVGALSAAHSWTASTGTLTLSSDYAHFMDVPSAGDASHDQLIDTLVAGWNRPLTPLFTLSADLGVLQAISVESPAHQLWQPTGGARLMYDFEYALATLSYHHGASLDVFTSSVNVVDQVALRAALPVSTSGLALSSSVGYARSTPISSVATLGRPSNVFVSDVALSFTPSRLPQLSVAVRGTLLRQIPVGDPPTGFTRIGVLADLVYSLPSAGPAALQNRIPPAYSGDAPAPKKLPPAEPAPGGPDPTPEAP